MKFGGTSVGSAERMRATAGIINGVARPVVVVLSAMSGITNRLIAIAEGKDNREDIIRHHTETARELNVEHISHELDSILSSAKTPSETIACGELMSTTLMTAYMQAEGVDAVFVPALDIMRLDSHGEPDTCAIRKNGHEVLERIGNHDVYVTQGFICRDSNGDVATLSRGGSDYTATLLGEALDADEVQIWTDVDGVYSADPRKVKNARCIPTLSYVLADTAARCGAKILHPDCVLPARRAGFRIKVLDSFHPQAGGTAIGPFEDTGGFVAVAATESGNEAVVSIIGRRGDHDRALVEEALPYALRVEADRDAVKATVPVERCTEAMNTLHRLIL